MEGTGTRWLVSLCCLLTAAQCVPSRVTSRLETDSEDSRRVLGSSVVTSVSVIMDHGNGTKTYFADGQSKHVQHKPTDAIIGSPGNLMSPDRYEFYTFDETGDLVKRLMTLDEIHGLIAGADPESVMADASPTYYHDALSSHSSEALMHLPASDLESLDAPAVHKVLESVQNVLKNEMAANSGKPAPHRPASGGPSSPLHRPDSASAWQALFPGLIETPDDVAHLSGYLLPSKTTESSADAPLTKKPTSPTPTKARPPPSTTAKSPTTSPPPPPSSSSSLLTTSFVKTQPPSTTTEKVRSTPKYSTTAAVSESTTKYDLSQQQSTTLKPQVTKKPFKPTQTFEKQKPSLQKPTAVLMRPTTKPSPMAADSLDINKEMSASISDMLSQVTDSQSSNHKPLQTNALVEKDNTADYVPEESSPELSYYSPMAMTLSTVGGLKPVTEALTSAKRPPTTSSFFKSTSTETPFSQKTSPNIITSTRFGPTKYNATKLRPPANVTASYMTKPLPINKFNGMNSTTTSSTTRNNYQYPPSNMSTKYMQKITQTTQAYPNKLIDSFVKVVNKTMMNNATASSSTFKQSTETSTVKHPTETTSFWNTTTAAVETKNKFTKEPNKVFQTKVTPARPNAVNRTNVTLSNRIQEPQKTTAIPSFSPSTTTVRSHTAEPEKFVSVKVEGWPLTSQHPTTAPPSTTPYAQTTEKSFFSSSNQPLNSFTDANTIRELISSLMVKSTTAPSVPTSTVSAAPTASSAAQETLTAAASTTSPTPVKTVTGVPASLLSSTEVPSTSTLTTTTSSTTTSTTTTTTSTAAPTTTAETTTTTAATGSAAVKTAVEEATTTTTAAAATAASPLTSASIIASDALTTASATAASLTPAGTTPVTYTPVALTSATASHTSSTGTTASLVMSSTGSTAPLVTPSTGSTGPLVTSSTGSTGPLVTSSTGSTSPFVTSSTGSTSPFVTSSSAAAKITSPTTAAVTPSTTAAATPSTTAATTPSTTTPESETHYVPVTHFLPELQVKDGPETENNGNSSDSSNGGNNGHSTPPGVDSVLEDGISAVANMLQNTQKPTVVDRPVPMEYQEIGGGYRPYDKPVPGDGKQQPQWLSSTERRPQVTVKSDTAETTVTTASDAITLRELYETTTTRDLDTTTTVTESVTAIADEISRNSEMLTVFNVSSSSAMVQEAKLADSSSSAETYLDSTTSTSFDRTVMTTIAVDPSSTDEPTTYVPPVSTASPATLTPATAEVRNSTAATPTAIDITTTTTTTTTTSSTTTSPTTAAYNAALKSPGPSSNAYRPPASPSAVELHPAPHESMGLEASVAFLGDDVRRFADLCNELSFKMWTAVTGKGQIGSRSLVLSPFELTAMLAMVFLGARGSTSGQMNDVLRLDDMVTFNPHQVLRNVTHSITNANNPGVATASFVREIYSHKGNGKILDFYKERVQQYYDGHVEEVDFNTIGDVLRRRTNLLVKRQTLGRVVEYLRGSGLSLTPPFAAFSANVFQTSCESASTEGRDGEMYFVVRPSTRQRRLVPVPAAVWRSGFLAGYEPGLDATAVCLGPDSAVSTILVLPGQQGQVAPGDGLARLEQRLIETSYRRGGWSRVLRSLLPRPGLELQVPRFSHRSVLNATAALQKMGLKDVFNDQKADLRGVNGLYDLYLSDMLQVNTFSTCGEDVIGARHHVETYPASPQRMGRVEMLAERRRRKRQAAAADDLPLYSPYSHLPLNLRPRQARLPDVPRLRFDRPFLYLVRHNPTGMIIYLGRFNPRLLP